MCKIKFQNHETKFKLEFFSQDLLPYHKLPKVDSPKLDQITNLGLCIYRSKRMNLCLVNNSPQITNIGLCVYRSKRMNLYLVNNSPPEGRRRCWLAFLSRREKQWVCCLQEVVWDSNAQFKPEIIEAVHRDAPTSKFFSHVFPGN